MQKKEIRLIGVAIIIGALAIGTYLYMESEDPLADLPEATPAQKVTTPVSQATAPAETATVPVPQVKTPEETAPKDIVPPPVDPIISQQQELLKNFKQQIFLDINLPSDMKYDQLDLDEGVAAMQGTSPNKKMVILAARRTATPQTIASYLQDQKNKIPVLQNHDFKISGDIKIVPAPKGSGISKITVIPGGEKNGQMIYAAHIERSDKKGSYVFVMEASPSYFDSREGDLDNMLDSLKIK